MAKAKQKLPILLSARVTVDFGDTGLSEASRSGHFRQEFVGHWVSRLSLMTEERGGELIAASGDLFQASMPNSDSAIAAACALVGATLPGMVGKQLVNPVVRVALHAGEAVGSNEYGEDQALESAARLTGLAAAKQILATREIHDAASEKQRECLRPAASAEGQKERAARARLYEVLWQQVVPMPATEDDVSARGTQRVTSIRIKADGPVRAAAPDQAAAGVEQPRQQRPQRRLRLTRGGDVQLVDQIVLSATIGRSKNNDIVVGIAEVSRQHATITFADGDFILADQSKNGTYVYDERGKESYVKDTEFELPGAGRLSLGLQANKNNAPVIHFRTETAGGDTDE